MRSRGTDVRMALAVCYTLLPTMAFAVVDQTPPPSVLVAPAEFRNVSPETEFVGRVKAADRVDIRARVTGFLGPRLFRDGDIVSEGQVLFRLDAAPYEAVAAQRHAAVQAAEAALQLADVQVQRGRELARSSALPQSQLDQREADQARARADLSLAQAALKEAGINLSFTQITSPIAGRIGDAVVSPGNLVTPDSGVLAVVVRQDPIDVTFPVSQRRLLEVAREVPNLGLNTVTVSLCLADGSRYDEKGHIDFIGVQADPRTDSVPMRAMFPNPKSLLYDGMSVRVIIEPLKPVRALIIPQAALLQDQLGSYVMVVEADNKAAQRRVKVENLRNGVTVVLDGLKEGDKVIVQGQARIRPGVTVTPNPWTPPS